MSISDSIDKDVLSFFRKIEDKSTDYINKLIVSSYVICNGLKVGKENYLYKYLITSKDDALESLNGVISQSDFKLGMEELVEVFEFVISPADKEVNGAVYTPGYLREAIIRNVLQGYDKNLWSKMLYGDLSCGCGGFFYSLIRILRSEGAVFSIADFVKSHIIGIDIKEYSAERTKILLSLYALQEGEELREGMFHILCQNSLSNKFTEASIITGHGGIDVVIGNPPYVASSKMSEDNRKYVKNWTVSKTGKSDLYLPFFQLGIECLKTGGTLGYITVNSFYRSLNGGAFRNYLSGKGLDCTIIDFGAEQLFKGCSTYTCICIIRDTPSGVVHYQEVASKDLLKLNQSLYEEIPYYSLDDKKGWILKDKNTAAKIQAIESIGLPLGDMVAIKNGFATLRNNIYLIKPYRSDEHYHYFKKEGTGYKVERAICRKAIKANIVRKESDIEMLCEQIIFPYHIKDGKPQVIDENKFQANYPFAYHYLIKNKDKLAERDNGRKKYPKWYAYGRSQALNIRGKRLLYPHICDHPCFVYCDDDSLMYYDGYSIFAKSPRQLEVIKRILSSELFWYYITKTSKPYSGGFFSLEKRYIRHFGIPVLTEVQEKELLALKSQREIDAWVKKMYRVNV